jgi:hypothetical protein
MLSDYHNFSMSNKEETIKEELRLRDKTDPGPCLYLSTGLHPMGLQRVSLDK